MRTVIRHKTDGLFVGHGMGLAFFSLLDSAGQYEIVSFDSEADAQEVLASMSFTDSFIAECTYHDVVSEGGVYISVANLKAAGLTEYLGDLEANYNRAVLESSASGAMASTAANTTVH